MKEGCFNKSNGEPSSLSYGLSRHGYRRKLTHFKGTCSRLVKFFFYNFFRPQTLHISSMKPSLKSLNRTTIFKLIGHGIELRAAIKERENKQI